ncbi:MAG: FtsH protease activity modulator HflK [Candidatus Euphemobacter frigidus]|nr:FtsH protease activity modulator HflK [Candidatus Euphemobacter frigidus]MDP8276469.1 FtsH protease activity modulator HflK [Candidatus Euphemobacter frigidus]
MDVNQPEDIILEVKKQLSQRKGKLIPIAIVVLLVVIGLAGTFYSIDADEVGVVRRFGRYIASTAPGLHYKLPFGIDKVTPVRIRHIFTDEFGVRTLEAGRKTRYSSRSYLGESLMLTGDLNILDVRWIVQYRIADPVKFLFNTRNPVNNIRDISEVVMRRLVGDYSVDEVLTTKRSEINTLAQTGIQKILADYETGVQIVTVKLQDVNPPDKVKPAFNEVNQAKQEKDKLVNQAWEAYNKIIPKARGEAERTIREAEGYAVDKINRARGDTERFISVLAEYKKAPEITKKRVYLETMSEIIPKARQKYIMDPKQTSILPLLNIGSVEGGQK